MLLSHKREASELVLMRWMNLKPIRESEMSETISASAPFLLFSGFTPSWGHLEKLLFLSAWFGWELQGASWPGAVCWGPESPEAAPTWLHLPAAIGEGVG